jgi:hypothetical protein
LIVEIEILYFAERAISGTDGEAFQALDAA